MFVLFAPSFVDYMCTLRYGKLYPLMNMKALCNYIGITLVKKVGQGCSKCLFEVNKCEEECLRLCSDNFGNVCTEGCRNEWN